MLKSLNVNEESRPAVLDAIDKSDRRKPEQTIEALESAIAGKGEFLWQEIQAIKKIDSLETLTERLSSCGSESEPIIQSWKEILALLQAHGADAFVKIDLSIVRGLAYYTGFVYEAFETTGDNRALAGGGRYDHLVKKLSGNVDMPACGFAIGDMTLTDCLESKGLLPKYILAPDLFLISGEEQRNLGVSLVAKARKGGFSTAYPLKTLGFGKQFKDAGKSGARYALILGEEEAKTKSVKVKDLRSSAERTIEQHSLVAKLEEFEASGGIQD